MKAKRTIFVVEDDDGAAKLLKARLENAGFEVIRENRGLAAVNFLLTRRPDLIILDIKLPDFNGFQLCQRVRRLHGVQLPILILTGLDQPADQMTGFEQGADAYLTKPYQSQELLKTIHLLLEQKESLFEHA